MTKIFLILSLVLTSAFLLSACTAKDQAELKILNKLDSKIDQKKAELNPQPTESEQDLLNELKATDDSGIDNQLNQIGTELKTN